MRAYKIYKLTLLTRSTMKLTSLTLLTSYGGVCRGLTILNYDCSRNNDRALLGLIVDKWEKRIKLDIFFRYFFINY